MSRFVYGPVPSRRLGRSLGVDILAPKSCTENCVYCQLGTTEPLEIKRRRFVDPRVVEKDLKSALQSGIQIDFITLSGSGEPTLSIDLGRIIEFARDLIEKLDSPQKPKICVLTNGSLLSDGSLREELASVDLVVPNLDAGDAETFYKINRPHGEIVFDKFIEGIKDFKSHFSGSLFLEIVLIEGLNDSEEHLRKIANIVSYINPDGVWVGTISRPPAEKWVKPVDLKVLQKAKEMIGEKARIIEAFHGESAGFPSVSLIDDISGLLLRRPETAKNIALSLDANLNEVLKSLYILEDKGAIERAEVNQAVYWKMKR